MYLCILGSFDFFEIFKGNLRGVGYPTIRVC